MRQVLIVVSIKASQMTARKKASLKTELDSFTKTEYAVVSKTVALCNTVNVLATRTVDRQTLAVDGMLSREQEYRILC